MKGIDVVILLALWSGVGLWVAMIIHDHKREKSETGGH